MSRVEDAPHEHGAAEASPAGEPETPAGEILTEHHAALLADYERHLQAERDLTAHTVRAYVADVQSLLLHGQRAVSHRLAGFDFRFQDLRAALADALGKPEPRDE